MLTFLIICFLAMLLFFVVFIWPYRDMDKLPGPSTFELIKNLYRYSSHPGLVTYFQTLNLKYGPTVKIWLKPLQPFIVTMDMEYVEKIFKSNDLHITPMFFEMSFMRSGIASHPDFNLWKKDKMLINKAISREYISGKINVYDKKYEAFLDIIRKNLGKSIDIEAPLHRIVLDIMMHTIKDSNVDLTEKEVQDYTMFREDFFSLLLEKMNSLHMTGFLHKFTNNYTLINKRRDHIVEFGRMWLKRFKEVKTEFRDKHNLVFAMLDGGMEEERVIDNINTLIQGGHETSILPLALGLQKMARNPEYQQKILNEIYSILGEDKSTAIMLNHLDQMVYLQAFVKECVRYYAPTPFLDRRTEKDMEIKGVKIPKGTVIMFYLIGILKSEENFGDPHVFNPDRFLKENLTVRTQKGYIAFGWGLKTCPGQKIAYAAMKLLLVKVLREFEICPLENDCKVELVSEIIFRSVNGIPVTFKKRS